MYTSNYCLSLSQPALWTQSSHFPPIVSSYSSSTVLPSMSVTDWSLCPPKFICWNPLNVRILGGRAVGGEWVMRVELSWMMLMPSWKRPQRDPSPLLLCEDTARRWPSMNQEVSPHQTLNLCWHFDLGLPASRSMRNTWLLLSSHSMFFFVVVIAALTV